MDLRARWGTLAGASPEAEATGTALLVSWSEPHRRYHDASHLTAVLDAIDWLDPGVATLALSVGWLARTAAWYHDAVYVVGREDNERASAQRAADELCDLGASREVAAEVARLVLLTTEHRCDEADLPGALLCDADLSVLGGEPAAYDAYAASVRAEYAVVEDPDWRVGRSAVLCSLLERPALFATARGRGRWEGPARGNLARELETLSAPGCGAAPG